MNEGPRDPRRRRLLAGLAVGTSLPLAGCLGGGDDEEGGGDGRDLPAVDDHPVDERMAFEDDHLCGVCRMPVTDYPEWMGQLAHEDGTGVFFCTSGCLVAYYTAAEWFGGPSAPIASAWTTEYGTSDRIDAYGAFFALERDGDGAAEPMHPNPRPFADEADAVAYVDDADDLSEADVIELEEFDQATARIYRPSHLP